MKIFIDTNVFLDFYRSQENSSKVLKSVVDNQKSLIIVDQVKHEFERNRDGMLELIIKDYEKYKIKPPFAPFLPEISEFNQLIKLIKKSESHVKNIIASLKEMLQNPLSDPVYQEITKLFSSKKIELISVTEETYQLALRRKNLGNPPGTDKSTICDQIIWESLLAYKKPDDLIIVSRDNTFLNNIRFLTDEYKNRTKKGIVKITDKVAEAISKLTSQEQSELRKAENEQLKEVYTWPLFKNNLSLIRDSNLLFKNTDSISDYSFTTMLKSLVDQYEYTNGPTFKNSLAEFTINKIDPMKELNTRIGTVLKPASDQFICTKCGRSFPGNDMKCPKCDK